MTVTEMGQQLYGVRPLLCSLVIGFCFVAQLAAATRGVSESSSSYYVASQTHFLCLDGSSQIPMDQVNDDYCDCADGSDEPGTSACLDASFYCINKGHRGKTVPSSVVDDTICDCCDGSDESAGACPNTCASDNAKWLEEHAEALKLAEDGARIKQQWITTAATRREEQRIEHETLEKEVADAKTAMDEQETLKNAAEAKDQAEKAARGDTDTAKALGIHNMNADDVRSVLFALVRKAQNSNDLIDLLHESFLDKLEPPEAPPSEEAVQEEVTAAAAAVAEGEESSTLEEGADLELDAVPEDIPDPPPTSIHWLDSQDTNMISDGLAAARKAFNDARSTYNSVNTRYTTSKTDLSTDFGPDDAFLMLKGECVEAKVQQYTYKVCPFDNAKQDHTSLGSFNSWSDDKYTEMKFEGGQKCWNGPSRSMTVSLVCGTSNELVNVSEPSTCAYIATLKTPAACDVLHATDLKVDQLSHDEL